MRPIAEYLLATGISALVMSVALVARGSTSAIKPARTARAVVAAPGDEVATVDRTSADLVANTLRDGKRGTSVAKATGNP